MRLMRTRLLHVWARRRRRCRHCRVCLSSLLRVSTRVARRFGLGVVLYTKCWAGGV